MKKLGARLRTFRFNEANDRMACDLSAVLEQPKDQDRQDAGAARNRPQNHAVSKNGTPNATTNATTAESPTARSDELLLGVIKAWPRLTAARQQMIMTIIETSV